MSIVILPPTHSGSFNNRIRRLLVSRLGWEQALSADRFGSFHFLCANGVEVFRTQDYGGEALLLATFLFLLKPDDIVWDIGASVGLFTVHSAAQTQAVRAFEPDPATSKRLKQNVALNKLSANVSIETCALGNQSGEFDLHTDGLSGNAPTLKSLGRHSQIIKIPVRTIDEVVASGILPPTVVKIDIEGAEVMALCGARVLLKSAHAPRLIVMEIHPKFLKTYDATPDDVLSLLCSAGYTLLTLRPEHDQMHVIATRELAV